MRTARAAQDADGNVLKNLIRECYRYVLIPIQEGKNKVGFKTERLSTEQSRRNIAMNVEHLLLCNEEVIQKWSPIFLKQVLEKNYFKDGQQKEVSAKTVWQDFCKYHSLPRLLDEDVFQNTVIDGIRKGEYFGFADGREGDKYLGFQYGNQVFTITLDESALLIENETAAAYKAIQQKPVPNPSRENDGGNAPQPVPAPRPGSENLPAQPGLGVQPKKRCKRYFGSVTLNPLQGPIDCQKIYEELVSLFTTKPGVKVTVKLDIEAEAESAFDDVTVRAAKENSKNLNLESSEFSED